MCTQKNQKFYTVNHSREDCHVMQWKKKKNEDEIQEWFFHEALSVHLMSVVHHTAILLTCQEYSLPVLPVLLPDMSQPLDPDPRDSAAADTPLPDEAEPVPEHASSWSKMSSRTLDMESASLFWASIGDSAWRQERRETTTENYGHFISSSSHLVLIHLTRYSAKLTLLFVCQCKQLQHC